MRFSKITRGFSLLEMLMTLALAAMLLSLAWPSWRHFFAEAEGSALLSRLSQALQFTHQQALLRQEEVTLCGSRDQKNCSVAWQEGLIVFLDAKQDGSLEDKSQILQVFHWGRPGGALHWRAFPQNREVCQFLPSGKTKHENGTFWYCSSTGLKPAWALALSQAAHLRVIYPDRQGQLKDERGRLLPCD